MLPLTTLAVLFAESLVGEGRGCANTCGANIPMFLVVAIMTHAVPAKSTALFKASFFHAGKFLREHLGGAFGVVSFFSSFDIL